MKNKCGFVLSIMLVMAVAMTSTALAHSGRTDANGGHKDNKNKSGLGSYHYHCGGHPAHLHSGGVCPYDPKDTISIKNAPSALGVGEEVALTWTVKAPSGSTPVTWDSSNQSVARVSSAGVLTALKDGSAVITATLRNGKKSFTVKVKTIRISSIALSCRDKTPTVGSVLAVNAAIKPSNATDKALAWSSSNEDVAVVLSPGIVLAIGRGSCNIVAKASDAGKKSASIKITVKSGDAVDAAAILAQWPADAVLKVKYGSAAMSFAQEHGLPFAPHTPPGLPFSLGDKGEAVADIQKALAAAGFLTGKADGVCGKKTETALRNYYLSVNAAYDGTVDENDYIAIMTALAHAR